MAPIQREQKHTQPLGLAEAFVAAGARTVLQKMWYDEESSLVDTVGTSTKMIFSLSLSLMLILSVLVVVVLSDGRC